MSIYDSVDTKKFKEGVENALSYLNSGHWIDSSNNGVVVAIEDMHIKHVENVIKYFKTLRPKSHNAVCIPYMERELARRAALTAERDSSKEPDLTKRIETHVKRAENVPITTQFDIAYVQNVALIQGLLTKTNSLAALRTQRKERVRDLLNELTILRGLLKVSQE